MGAERPTQSGQGQEECITSQINTSILDLAAVGVLQTWLDSPTFTLKFAMLESSRKACYVYEGPLGAKRHRACGFKPPPAQRDVHPSRPQRQPSVISRGRPRALLPRGGTERRDDFLLACLRMAQRSVSRDPPSPRSARSHVLGPAKERVCCRPLRQSQERRVPRVEDPPKQGSYEANNMGITTRSTKTSLPLLQNWASTMQ